MGNDLSGLGQLGIAYYEHPYIGSIILIVLGALFRSANLKKDEQGKIEDDGPHIFGSILITIGSIVIAIKLYIDYNNYKSSHTTYTPTQYNKPNNAQPVQYTQLYSQPVQYYQPQYYTH